MSDDVSEDVSADEICALLKLEPNQTCAFVRVTYVSERKIRTERPVGSALYFMVTPDAPVQLHRIRNDQLYHYYRGDPLELLLLKAGGTNEKVVIGPDLTAGQHVQFFIPGNTFHTARVVGRHRWFFGRQHGMARRYPGRCRAGRCRCVGEEVSGDSGGDPQLSATCQFS